MAFGFLRAPRTVQTYLFAFGLAVSVPVVLLAGLLLVRSAELERTHLEGRVKQIAHTITESVDRDLSGLITTLDTLKTSPALRAGAYLRSHATVAPSRPSSAARIVSQTSALFFSTSQLPKRSTAQPRPVM